MPAWANGSQREGVPRDAGEKPIWRIFSVGVEERYRWKDSVKNADEITLFVADGVANGLRRGTKFSGKVYDPRWLAPVSRAVPALADWEPYLRNVAPVAKWGWCTLGRADVALLWPRARDAAAGGAHRGHVTTR